MKDEEDIKSAQAPQISRVLNSSQALTMQCWAPSCSLAKGWQYLQNSELLQIN